MLTVLLIILTVLIFGKLFAFGLKAAWGLSRILLTCVLLPIVLILLMLGGLFIIAIPILACVGLATIIYMVKNR